MADEPLWDVSEVFVNKAPVLGQMQTLVHWGSDYLALC